MSDKWDRLLERLREQQHRLEPRDGHIAALALTNRKFTPCSGHLDAEDFMNIQDMNKFFSKEGLPFFRVKPPRPPLPRRDPLLDMAAGIVIGIFLALMSFYIANFIF